jgi:hypothetical protein
MAIEDELHREVASGGKQRSERSPESPSFWMVDFGRRQHFSDYPGGGAPRLRSRPAGKSSSGLS